jgi:EamA domain-containing membrane protein RarD
LLGLASYVVCSGKFPEVFWGYDITWIFAFFQLYTFGTVSFIFHANFSGVFFLKKWTSISCIPSALLEILVQYPHVRFMIATLGENGCMMLERSEGDQYWTLRLDAIFLVFTSQFYAFCL